LVGDEDSAVELSSKLTFKFSSTFLVSILKDSVEVFQEGLVETLLDKFST
jgi:hypothetical protein